MVHKNGKVNFKLGVGRIDLTIGKAIFSCTLTAITSKERVAVALRPMACQSATICTSFCPVKTGPFYLKILQNTAFVF
ncbi:MAG TPA: hypothetical protein VLZ54_07830 [Arenibacter sp.]|nr:hypothetical protein [Arenibacter sp.]